MTSGLVSSPHSCDFCRNLTLYRRDTEEWWEKAIALGSEDLEDVEVRLSIRVKEWLIKQFGEEPKVGKKSIHSKRNEYLLWSLCNIVIFDCTVAEASEAAANGCTLCFCIVSDNQIESKNSSFLAASIIKNDLYFGAIQMVEGHIPSKKEYFEVMPLGNRRGFEIIALADDDASKEVSARPVNTRPASDESLTLVRTWLKTCLDTHQICPKPKGNFMPSRVIEIMHDEQGQRSLRLRETNSRKPEPYVALSYCWGGEQQVTTTKETFSRHRIRMNMQDLPATVRDAILVAESLGILKIWIDAFCIIQDDQLDKAWEIAQMPLIYSQAIVTIAASRANRVDDGFLQNRRRMGDDNPNLVFKLPFQCSNNQLSSVVLLPEVEIPSTEPLDLRAWALQERFLSTRILEYRSIQTRWICQNSDGYTSTTDGYKDWNVETKNRSDNLFTWALQAVLRASDLGLPARDRPDTLRQYWYDLVNVYTHRTLTLDTDRLPAISGIAAHFGITLRDKYKAGLWESKMGYEILWITDPFSRNLRPRPLEYLGPSWSWAALNVPVRLFMGAREENYVDIVDCQIRYPATNIISSVYDASYGAVESGSLKLKGRLQPAEWIQDENLSASQHSFDYVLRKRDVKGPDGTFPARMYPDALEAEFANGDASSMPVFLLKVSSPRVRGLVLRQHGDSEFSRLGVFYVNEKYMDQSTRDWSSEHQSRHFQQYLDWLDSSPLQTITIV